MQWVLVIQWLSNVHLHCWFADSGRQKYFYRRENNSCSLCPWNFWIVASGSADTLNEEINMFTFYSIYLWNERSALMLCRVVPCLLQNLPNVCSALGRCPLCSHPAWLSSELRCSPVSPGWWYFPVGSVCLWRSVCSMLRLSVPTLLCTAGAMRCAGPGLWVAGVHILPTGTNKHFSRFSSGQWDGEYSVENAKEMPKE